MDGLLSKLEEMLRAGKNEEAQSELRRLPHKRRLTRAHRFSLAAAARRAGLPDLTVKLLNPIVRPPPRSPMHATAAETAEYAAALIRVGAPLEGLQLLDGVDTTQVPRALLYKAHGLFTQWNYRESIPLLRQFIRDSDDPYQKAVGEANLVQALVHERSKEADAVLLHALEDTRRQGLGAFHANVLERMAEQAIYRRKWSEAERLLENAASFAKEAKGLAEFFVRKWKMVLKLHRSPHAALADLEKFRREAAALPHWETVRDCDYYRAVTLKDVSTLQHVYFGTPYPDYRDRLLKDFGETGAVPDTYVFKPGLKRSKVHLDLVTGVVQGIPKTESLKPGQLKHRLLDALCSDFYRPKTVPGLFAALHPENVFHPLHSPTGVHQAIKTLRKWFEANRIPAEIEQSNGLYRLSGKSAVEITLAGPASELKKGGRLNEIRSRCEGRAFTARETARWLSIPRRTAFYLLQEGLENGTLGKSGKGAETTYYFKH